MNVGKCYLFVLTENSCLWFIIIIIIHSGIYFCIIGIEVLFNYLFLWSTKWNVMIIPGDPLTNLSSFYWVSSCDETKCHIRSRRLSNKKNNKILKKWCFWNIVKALMKKYEKKNLLKNELTRMNCICKF